MAPDSRLSEQPRQAVSPRSLSSSLLQDAASTSIFRRLYASTLRFNDWKYLESRELMDTFSIRSNSRGSYTEESSGKVLFNELNRSSFITSTDKTSSDLLHYFLLQFPRSGFVKNDVPRSTTDSRHDLSDDLLVNFADVPDNFKRLICSTLYKEHFLSPNEKHRSSLYRICNFLPILLYYFFILNMFAVKEFMKHLKETLLLSSQKGTKYCLERPNTNHASHCQSKTKNMIGPMAQSKGKQMGSPISLYTSPNIWIAVPNEDCIQAPNLASTASNLASEPTMEPISSPAVPLPIATIVVSIIKFYLVSVFSSLSSYYHRNISSFESRRWMARCSTSSLPVFSAPSKTSKTRMCSRLQIILQLLLILLCLPKGK